MKRNAILILSFMCSLAISNEATTKKLATSFKGQFENEKIHKNSQKKVDELAIKKMSLFEEYKRTLTKIKNTEVYNKQLQDLIDSQETEKVSLVDQIASIKETNEGVIPFMFEMLATLENFISKDTPFLMEERSKRIDSLKEMMKRADVSTSEKFRRILEAYQIENEYGRTIEAYRGVIKKNKNEVTVDFLKMGRMALYYQTLDKSEQALWDKANKKWVTLDSGFESDLFQALKVARKQTTPDILTLGLKKETI